MAPEHPRGLPSPLVVSISPIAPWISREIHGVPPFPFAPISTVIRKKLLPALFMATSCVCGVAHASPRWTLGANLSGSHAEGYGKSSNFGLDIGYDLNPRWGVDLSYESLMGYEMTVIGASAIRRHAIGDGWQIFGRLGVSYWTESPTGAYNASGEDPLLGIGLSYAIDRSLSVQAEYQVIPNLTGNLGVNLDTALLGLQYHF